MKKFLVVGFIVIAPIVIFAVAGGTQDESHVPPVSNHTMEHKVNVDLDESSAIQIAEVVLVRVYGKEVLDQRPWNVTKNGKIFRIEGTLKHPKEITWANMEKGGVALIEINQMNAEVVSIIHGK